MPRLLDSVSPLPLEPLAPDTVVEGSPYAGIRALTDIGGVEVGVWEMTVGTATDVEVDEVFVVLSGSASIAFDDGEVIEVQPGSVVRLHEGDRTTWTVRETLRKFYVA